MIEVFWKPYFSLKKVGHESTCIHFFSSDIEVDFFFNHWNSSQFWNFSVFTNALKWIPYWMLYIWQVGTIGTYLETNMEFNFMFQFVRSGKDVGSFLKAIHTSTTNMLLLTNKLFPYQLKKELLPPFKTFFPKKLWGG